MKPFQGQIEKCTTERANALSSRIPSSPPLNLEDDHPWEPLPLFATPFYSSPPREKKKKDQFSTRLRPSNRIDLAMPIILPLLFVGIGS